MNYSEIILNDSAYLTYVERYGSCEIHLTYPPVAAQFKERIVFTLYFNEALIWIMLTKG